MAPRELKTELGVAVAFVAAAAALALGFGGSPDWTAVLWLTAVYAVLARIEFEVGEGHVRPIQLAFIPMLVVLPPGLVPVAVVVAHLAETLTRGRTRPQRLLLQLPDSSFALAPALLFALAGPPTTVWALAGLCLAALATMIASDLAVSSLRMRLGLGMNPRGELRGFAWIYMVDACLASVGFFAALAAREHPALVAGVLPLAALLAIFARERRGRIENAQALERTEREGRERLQTIVQNSSDCILIIDPAGAMRTLIGNVEPIFGASWAAAEGTPLLDHVHPQDGATVRAFLQTVANRPAGEPQNAEWRMRYADGNYRHAAAAASSLLGDERVRGIVVTLHDVEERKAFEEQLRHRAFHDALTGLANRALFYDRIEHALTRGARDNVQAGVLFVDLDDFKTVNDTRGHAEGDRLLQAVAERLTACLRAGDTAARLGGDEFGVLLERVAGTAALQAAALRILDALAEPVELENGPITVSASVGMALSTPRDRGADEFLRHADLAMYEAKRGGKRRAELYAPEHERRDAAPGLRGQWFARDDEQRAEIEAVLQDPDGIEIVFQPIMDLRTGRIAGYESLSRFAREPRRGPDEWFAQAHRCGLGYALEAKAITTALATPGRPAGTYLTFNVSPSALLAEEVLAVLPERLHGLVVEITENELVSGDPAIHEALAALRARGARLAVDDTGAGYAGLTHVMRLQPDIIKLDRALTTGVDTDPAKAPLISSFVRYARDIDADVCAEGVETLRELECLADLDVAYGQGYGIARPSPPWTPVSPAATDACLTCFQATLRDADDGAAPAADHDRRLELLARRLAGVTSTTDLDACLAALAEELHAHRVTIAAPGEHGPTATQLLVDDPHADPAAAQALAAAGYGSRLTIPISHAADVVGHLVAYAHGKRPWSRHQIGRARLLCYQLGAQLRGESQPAG